MNHRRLFYLLVIWVTVPLCAHPMGNFSVSHYTSILVEGDHLEVRYRLDLAEIPSAQEMPLLDADRNGVISEAEREAYLGAKVPKLTAGQSVKVDGRPVPLTAVSSDVRNRAGAGDLPTLLLTIDYRAPLAGVHDRTTIEYADDTFPGRKGWREIVGRASAGLRVIEATIPETDRSRALESYPAADPFTPPPDDTVGRMIVS